MTTRDVPSDSARAAAMAELRTPSTLVAVLAMPVWFGGWAWYDGRSDASGGVALGVLGVVLGGLTFHRLVRRRRGLTATHPAAPLVAAVAMVVMYAAVNAVEPVISATGIAVSVGGTFVVLLVAAVVELLVERRRQQQVPHTV